jgi:hypothetical protein
MLTYQVVPTVTFIGADLTHLLFYARTAMQALWVLTHELGHALHLALSSHRASFGAESGLQLPLEALEVGEEHGKSH